MPAEAAVEMSKQATTSAQSPTSDAEAPVEHLFKMVLTGAAADRHDFVGPFGRRAFERPSGGTVAGARVNGQVLSLLATDYGNASLDGRIRQVDAYITAQTDDGAVILMQVRGRGSPTYGPGGSRIHILFTVGAGPYEWLNGVMGIGFGRENGEDTEYDVYAITDLPVHATGGKALTGEARKKVALDYLFTRRSQYEPGAKRHVINGPLGGRFLTLAEHGGAFKGKLQGQFLPGYSWSPHRMGTQNDQGLMHYDVKTLLRTDDGTPILMSYVGLSYPMIGGRPWITAVLFETPETGPHAWLNEVQAIGVGRWMGDGAEYTVYCME